MEKITFKLNNEKVNVFIKDKFEVYTFLYKIIISRSVLTKFSEKELKPLIVHETFHKKPLNIIINLTVVVIVILIVIYSIVKFKFGLLVLICVIAFLYKQIEEYLADRYSCKISEKKYFMKSLKKYDKIVGYNLGRRISHPLKGLRYWLIEKTIK